jgi:hypothetical protein
MNRGFIVHDFNQIIVKHQNLFNSILGVDSEYFAAFTGENIQCVMFCSFQTGVKGKAVLSKAAIMDKTFDMHPPSISQSIQSQTKKVIIPDINDYGINSSGDSSEDDEKPKRPIPLWATSKSNALVNKSN